MYLPHSHHPQLSAAQLSDRSFAVKSLKFSYKWHCVMASQRCGVQVTISGVKSVTRRGLTRFRPSTA